MDLNNRTFVTLNVEIFVRRTCCSYTPGDQIQSKKPDYQTRSPFLAYDMLLDDSSAEG
jgi:hypothetical protein